MSAVNGFETLAHVLGLRSGPTVFLSIVVRLAAPLICGDPDEILPLERSAIRESNRNSLRKVWTARKYHIIYINDSYYEDQYLS
jgi:hypothetical protein